MQKKLFPQTDVLEKPPDRALQGFLSAATARHRAAGDASGCASLLQVPGDPRAGTMAISASRMG